MFTMSDIKNHVNSLKWQSIKEYENKLNIDFENYLEEHSEIALEISEYEAACQKADSLYKKHNDGHCSQHTYGLKRLIRSNYMDSRKDETQKIKDQFYTIEQKLKAIRSPQKAVEFLKLCGIELPDNGQIQQDIPVDPEFIKSILPAPKQLTNN
jgi:hypothetical protein